MSDPLHRRLLIGGIVTAIICAALITWVDVPLALHFNGFRETWWAETFNFITDFANGAIWYSLAVIGLIAAMTTAGIIGMQPNIEIGSQTIPTFFMMVAVFWYPLFDSLQVYVRRMRRGNSPFVADRSHVHHHLLGLYNKNHIKVSMSVIALTLLISLLIQLNIS